MARAAVQAGGKKPWREPPCSERAWEAGVKRRLGPQEAEQRGRAGCWCAIVSAVACCSERAES